MQGMRMFSVINMKNSFWQVALDEENSSLCTSKCAYGRYSFRRQSFNVNIALEVMQKRNTKLFGDIQSVYVVFDDIIVSEKDESEHDDRLRTVRERARKQHVRFKKNKIQYKVTEVKYVDYIMPAEGLRPDNEKVRAINDMTTLACAQDLSRFLSVSNYLSRYVPNYTSVIQLLRLLFRKDIDIKSTTYDVAYCRIKELITC